MRLDHGKNASFLVQAQKSLGFIDKVKLEWTYNYNYYEFMSTCWAFLCNSKLFVKRLEVVDMDAQAYPQLRSQPQQDNEDKDSTATFRTTTTTLCGEEGTTYTGIPSGGGADFHRHC